jgi:hypothetical protein
VNKTPIFFNAAPATFSSLSDQISSKWNVARILPEGRRLVEEGFSDLGIMKNCGLTSNWVVQLRIRVIPTQISRECANSNRDIMENMMPTDLDIKGHQPGEAEDGMKEDE